MKLTTHNIFTIGVLTAIGLTLTSPVNSLITACILSVIGNGVIDKFGHKKNGMGMPVRTFATHSFLRGTIWGFLPATFLYIAARFAWTAQILPYAHPYWILLQGLFVGPLHLAIDIITEGGIFIKKNGRFQRFAIAYIPYDSFLWNSFFKIIGLFILFVIFNKFFAGLGIYRFFKGVGI